MKRFILLSLIAFAPHGFGAEGDAAAKTPPYQLKSHSNFKVSEDTRTPFWPIGWVRPGSVVAVVGAPVQADFQLEARFFRVTSVLLGSPALATINGRAFAEGEMLPVMRGNERLKVIVRAIRDGGVVLDFNQQRLFVPIAQEVVQKNAKEKPAEMKDFSIQILDKP
jgi:hypothetical protein